MKKLSIDIETKILNDMDEKIHELTRMGVERPELIKVVNKVERYQSADVAYAYHILDLFRTGQGKQTEYHVKSIR